MFTFWNEKTYYIHWKIPTTLWLKSIYLMCVTWRLVMRHESPKMEFNNFWSVLFVLRGTKVQQESLRCFSNHTSNIFVWPIPKGMLQGTIKWSHPYSLKYPKTKVGHCWTLKCHLGLTWPFREARRGGGGLETFVVVVVVNFTFGQFLGE